MLNLSFLMSSATRGVEYWERCKPDFPHEYRLRGIFVYQQSLTALYGSRPLGGPLSAKSYKNP
jgi:hypothetical protein